MNILYFLPLYNHTNGTMMILLFALVCLMLTYAVASIINKNQKRKIRKKINQFFFNQIPVL